MKPNVIHNTLKGVGMFALLFGASSGAYAVNTASGTTISNSATVNYSVSGIAQAAINSTAYTFVVDNKVIPTVSDVEVAAVSVTPGSSNNVLRFTVTNSGNTTQDFALSAIALTGTAAKFGGATDNKDATSVAVYVDSNANNVYDVGVDTGTHINALASGASVKVFVVASFATTGFVNNDIASYYLSAEARTNDGAGTLGAALTDDSASADNKDSVQIVFADTDATGGNVAKDAKQQSNEDYKVVTSELSISKTSIVISDPINNTTNPKRIPGAVVEYQITVSNGATGATATSVAITDSLNTEIATNGTLAFNTQYNATAGSGIHIIHSSALPAGAEFTNANDGAENATTIAANWNVSAANTVTVSGISLAASENVVIKFRVTIQ